MTENAEYLAIMFFSSASFEVLGFLVITYKHEQVFQIFWRAAFITQVTYRQISLYSRSIIFANYKLVFPCVKSVKILSFFWSVFSRIQTRKKSVYGHFSRSGTYLVDKLNKKNSDAKIHKHITKLFLFSKY